MDSTDDLLADLLARPDGEWRGGLEAACRAHPDREAELRRRFAHLERCGVAAPIVEPIAARLPERFGPYRLLRRLAEGGMGSVWLALHESLGREVAIKMIRPERLWFENARERFQREIEAVARLRHPGCVQIHQVGDADGVPYFAMEYVAGANCEQVVAALRARLATVPLARLSGADLAAVLRQGGTPVESSASELFGDPWVRVVVRIVLAATEAVAHAHARGVVHRDLKPSNLMLTPEGRVVVVDFGLADAAGTSALTREGSQLGSVPYMAPEQLRGTQAKIGVRTDVRGLGVCLHELLALAPPFAAQHEPQLRADILAGTAADLRAQNPMVPRDLAVVTARAMHVDPERRYGSALELASDLMAVLEDRPVQARRDAVGARLLRLARRRPALATAVGILLLGLLLGPIVISVAIAGQRDRAQAAELQARQREYVANVAAAAAALDAGNGEEARLRLAACKPELRGFEWHHLELGLDASFLVVAASERAVTAAAVTPDGARVVAGGADGGVAMFDLADGRRVRTFRSTGAQAIAALAFDAAGAELFVLDAEQDLHVHDVATGELRRERRRAAVQEHLRFDDPVDRIVIARGGGRVAMLDPHSLVPGAEIPLALRDWPDDNRFLLRGSEVVAGMTRGLEIWSAVDGTSTAELAYGQRLQVLGVATDRPTVAALDAEGLVLWTPGEPAGSSQHLGGRQPIAAQFLRGDRFVVLPCRNGEVLVSDPETHSWRTRCGHRGAVTAVAAVPRTSTFVTGGADGTVRLWSATAVQNRVDLIGGGWGRALAIEASGRLFTGAEDAVVAAVDPATGAVAWHAQHPHWVNALAVVESERSLVASVGGDLWFWSTVDGSPRGTLALPAGSDLATCIAVAPSGALLAVTDRAGRVTVVDPLARAVRQQVRRHEGPITEAVWTGSGRLLTCGLDGRVLGCDPTADAPGVELCRATAACRAMARVGAVLYVSEHALGGASGMLSERDASTGALLRSHPVGDAIVVLRALGDNRLVAGTESGRVVLWDRTLLVPILELELFSQRVRNLVVDPNGEWIAAIGARGDPKILHATRQGNARERLQVADLRDRIRTALQVVPWRPLAEQALRTDPELDAAARSMGQLLLPPLGRWDLGLAAHELATPPAPSAATQARLRTMFAALDEALHTPVDSLDLLTRTGHALVAVRLGEPAAALASTAAITLDPRQGPSGTEGQFRPVLHFVRGMAHHQLGDDAAARTERDLLAALAAGDFASDTRIHLLLRELDDALR